MKLALQIFKRSISALILLLIFNIDVFSQCDITYSIKPVSCYGGNDGSVTINIQGKTGPYWYTILNESGTITYNTANTTHTFGNLKYQDPIFIVMQYYSPAQNKYITCPNFPQDSITQPDPIIFASPNIVDNICNGGTTGSIDISVSGGIPPYSYSWSNGAITEDISNLASGSYTVTVTDDNNCSMSSTYNVTAPNVVAVDLGPDQTICLGKSATLTATSGLASYAWSNGQSGSNSISVSPTVATTYIVNVTNNIGCAGADTITINVNPLPIVTVSPNQTICLGESADIDATPGFDDYNWSNGDDTESINVTPGLVGNNPYTVTVTDANGCQNSASTNVLVNPLPVVSVNSPTICIGQSATLNATPGFTTYTWNPNVGSTASVSVSPLADQSYTVTVKDANNCINSATSNVTVNPLPVVAISPNQAICLGQSATINATPGFDTYSWNPNIGSSSSVSVSPPVGPNTYTVTVTDANNCQNSASTIVTVNPLPVVNITPPSQAICLGQSATINATPGFDDYIWSTGDNTASITVTPPNVGTNSYTLTVTDGNNCSNTVSTTVTVNPLPVVSVNSPTICIGQSATLNATPGFTTYTWNPNVGSTASVSVSPAVDQSYTVTVKDANNCINSATSNVTVNPLPVVTVSPNQTICLGQSATINATPGFDDYIWSSGQTTASISVSPAVGSHSYTVTVTDANGCENSATTNVTVNPLPVVTVSPNQTICLGQSAAINATPGFDDYIWSSGQTTASISVSPAVGSHSYTVTVTDANGCENSATTNITVNPLPVVTVSPNQTICLGQSATINATPGFNNYSWNPNVGNTASISVSPPVGPNTYTVTVTDANNCQNSATTNVTVNPLPVVTVTPDQTICLGQSATINATPGFNDYIWSNGDDTESITVTPGVGPNPYSVTVTDANGCTNSASTNVTVNPIPGVTITPDQTICFGQSATINVTPGFTTYNWNPNVSSSSSVSVSPPVGPNPYTVIVTDVNGCQASLTTNVIVNPVPIANAGANVSICPGFSTVLNGSGGGDYLWTPSSGLTSNNTATTTASPASTTTYTLTITAANGCTDTDDVTVTVNPDIAVAGSDVTICEGSSTTLTALGGDDYTWAISTSPGSPISNDPSVTVSPTTTTTYTVTVQNASGCTDTDDITVTVNPKPNANAGADVAICPGASTTLTASGGNNYSWTTPTGTVNGATITVSPISTTTYIVTVTDANNCTNTDDVTVAINPLPAADAGPDVSICPGSSTTLTASGGNNYSWTTPTGTVNGASLTVAPVSTTTYTVTVTDANNCTNTDDVVVTITPEIAVAGSDVTICEGSSANLLATGGTIYSWTPATGLSADDIPNPVASPTSTITYTVTVTDAFNCTDTDEITVTVNPRPIANAGSDAIICPGFSTPLSASGGDDYLWTPSTDLTSDNTASTTASPSVTTTYTVTVTDANGCTDTDDVIVTVNPDIAVAGTDATICEGSSVTLSASGGDDYSWSGGPIVSGGSSATPTVNPINTTTYTVTVTDAAGCTDSDEVIVTVNPKPVVSAGTDVSICPGSNTSLSASGGNDYSWSPSTGLNDPSISNPITSPVITTTYTVTVTDANNCTNTDDVIVTVTPEIAAAGNDVSICEGSSANLLATGGTIYSWTPATGLSADDIPNPVASPTTTITYTVTVTDAFSCTDTDEITVTVNPLPLANAGTDAIICPGFSTALSASGGDDYSWSPSTGLSSDDIPNPTANPIGTTTYIVTVTDANGCTDSDDVIVTVTPDIAVAGVDASVCEGSSITLSASGGDDYSWSGGPIVSGGNTANPTVNPTNNPTTYTVTVTDAAGCTDSDDVIVTVNPLPVVSAGADQNICLGISADLEATTGLTSYSWTPGNESTSSITVTPTTAGTHTYTVTVTDANNCENSASVNVNASVGVTGTASANPSTVCKGTASTISASLDGSYTPHANAYSFNGGTSFQAGNSHTTPAINSDTTVTVVLKDINGCISDNILVNISINKFIADLTVTNLVCNGDNGGNITINNVTGGTGPYNYFVNGNPYISGTASLGAGNHVVTIQDIAAGGCSYDTTVTITEPPVLIASALFDSPICSNGNNGEITLTATGGTGSYEYSNDNITYRTSNVFSGLNPNTYIFYVKDINGCVDNVSATLSSFPAVDLSLINVDSVHLSCNSVNTGEIHLSNIIGGTRPFTFNLIGGIPQSDSSFIGLGAGKDTIIISDANGCSYKYGFEITQPDPINFNLTLVKVETCTNADGAFKLSDVIGGLKPNKYTYSFNGQLPALPYEDIDVNFEDLSSDNYTIEVFDLNAPGCKTGKSILIPRKPGPIPFVRIDSVKCYKGSDGKITIDSIEGGAPLFKKIILNKMLYNADSSQFTILPVDSVLNIGANTIATFDGLSKASYFMTIEDQECIYDTHWFYVLDSNHVMGSIYDIEGYYDTIFPVVNVYHPDSIEIDISTTNTDRYLKTGTASIYNFRGGKGPYFYSTDNSTYYPVNNATDTIIISGLDRGTYTVYIRDINSCVYEFIYVINVDLYVPNLFTPNNDGHNDFFEIMALPEGSELRVYNRWGSRVYFNKNYDNSWDGGNEPDGVYYYDLDMPNRKLVKGWIQLTR